MYNCVLEMVQFLDDNKYKMLEIWGIYLFNNFLIIYYVLGCVLGIGDLVMKNKSE